MTHRGKKVFFAEYSHMSIEELRTEVAAVEPVLCSMPKDSVLSLADVRGTYGTHDAINVLKGVTAKTKSHVHKRAVVGVTGVQKILLKAVNQFSGQETVAFDSMDEALEWLVKD
jgi:Holliday junction resolvasome RuvABC endonuclease subunit